MTVPEEEATTNYGPAVAVILSWQAVSGMIGAKGGGGGLYSEMCNAAV